MPKRRKKQAAGAPEWMVTFGDMMALLLTFFILLQMFSELKREHEYQRVITAVQAAFGLKGGVGVMPTDDLPMKSMVEQLEELEVKSEEHTKISQGVDEGLDGPQMRVKSVREGVMFTVGGPSTFEPASAELTPDVRAELRKVAVMLKGRRNKVIVRGHAAAKHLAPDGPWRDLDHLSFARASAVARALVELGVEDRMLRIEAAGIREPVRPRAVDPSDLAENRRVEIIMTTQLVDEVNTDAAGVDPANARGGWTDE